MLLSGETFEIKRVGTAIINIFMAKAAMLIRDHWSIERSIGTKLTK